MTAPLRFADLQEAARELAAVVLAQGVGGIELVLALGEPAMPIAEVLAQQVGGTRALLPVERGDAPVIGVPPQCAGLNVVVVDRGVETGQSALLAAACLRTAGAARLTLAVPVCPRQAESSLARAYDRIISVHRPLARRSLQWHYVAPLE